MAQSQAESTRDTYNYGQYINQFPLNTIKEIREYERIQKKICRQKMSIMFNEIFINEEKLPKYIYVCVCGSICVVAGWWNHLQHLWNDASVSRYSFVYFGLKTTQRAMPTKICKTRREDEEHQSFRSETPEQRVSSKT